MKTLEWEARANVEKMVETAKELRNKAVHQGQFPNSEDVGDMLVIVLEELKSFSFGA